MHSLWKGYLPENLFSAGAAKPDVDGEWDESDIAPLPADGRASP